PLRERTLCACFASVFAGRRTLLARRCKGLRGFGSGDARSVARALGRGKKWSSTGRSARSRAAFEERRIGEGGPRRDAVVSSASGRAVVNLVIQPRRPCCAEWWSSCDVG